MQCCCEFPKPFPKGCACMVAPIAGPLLHNRDPQAFLRGRVWRQFTLTLPKLGHLGVCYVGGGSPQHLQMRPRRPVKWLRSQGGAESLSTGVVLRVTSRRLVSSAAARAGASSETLFCDDDSDHEMALRYRRGRFGKGRGCFGARESATMLFLPF
jgi:hypothetical protein